MLRAWLCGVIPGMGDQPKGSQFPVSGENVVCSPFLKALGSPARCKNEPQKACWCSLISPKCD